MSELVVSTFTEADLQGTSHFHCGDAIWERDVADWISGKGSVEPKMLTLISKGQTEVWLYRLKSSGNLVGYTALTKIAWKIQNEWKDITLLQAFGIQKHFQGKPEGPRDARYSIQMMQDLAAKAISYGRPIWGLLVHKDNIKAQRLYQSIGFVKYDEPRKTYYRMALQLIT